MKPRHCLLTLLLCTLGAWLVSIGMGGADGARMGLVRAGSDGRHADEKVGGAQFLIDDGANAALGVGLRTLDVPDGDGGSPLPENAQWCAGRIQWPDGVVPPDDMVVVAEGNRWPDGQEQMRVPVGLDGEFRVAFSPGTYRGLITLDSDGLVLAPTVVWRPWFQGVLLLAAQRSYYTYSVHLQDGQGGAVDHLRLDRLQGGVLSDATRTPVLNQNGGTFEDFPPGRQATRYLAWGAELAPVLVSPRTARSASPSESPLILRRPARVSVTVELAEQGSKVGGWLQCTQPFRRVRNGELGPLMTHMACSSGNFEFQVPAGQELKMRVGAKGLGASWRSIGTLQPGEHRRGVRLQANPLGTLRGRVVDSDGEPVVGAWVRSLAWLYSDEGSADDPGMGPMHATVTDGQGRFELKGLGAFESVPLEVSLDSASGGSVAPGSLWSAGRRSQHFEGVEPGAGLQRLVFAPGDSALQGRVVDLAGEPLPEYWLTLVPGFREARRSKRGAGGGVIDVDRSPLLTGGSSSTRWFDEEVYSARRKYLVRDPGGEFRIQVAPGKWDLRVDAAGHCSLRLEGLSAPNVTAAQWTLPAPASLEVLLTDDLGEPWVGQALLLSSEDDEELQIGPPAQGGLVLHTDRAGRARVEGLTPGRYAVLARGAQAALFPKKYLTLGAGESRELRVQMPKFGSIRVVVGWDANGRTVNGTLHKNGKSVGTSGVVQTPAELFFPEVPPGSYSMRFRVGGEIPGANPIFADVPVQVTARVVTSLIVEPISSACLVAGRVTLNGKQVDSGKLKFSIPGSRGSNTLIPLGPHGEYRATLAEPGVYGVSYLEGRCRRKVSFALVDVPPGGGTSLDIALQDGRITLQLPPGSTADAPLSIGARHPVKLTMRDAEYGDLTSFVSSWTGGKATWESVPPGTYRVASAGNTRNRRWRVKPGQDVVLPPGVARVVANVEWERLYELGGECDLSTWPASKSGSQPLANGVYLRIWGDAHRETLLMRAWVGGGPVIPFRLQGVPLGDVWITVDPSPVSRYQPSAAQGPFKVTSEGVGGVSVRFDFPSPRAE